jgi:hypothetical protein
MQSQLERSQIMAHTRIIKSFAELGQLLELEPESVTSANELPQPPENVPTGGPTNGIADLETLLAGLEEASATLATAAQSDQEARTCALRELEQYDLLIAQDLDATRAAERAQTVCDEAETLVEAAFSDGARAEAERVLRQVSQIVMAARQLVECSQDEIEQLKKRPNLARLLAERDWKEEAERAKAAEAERAQRLSEALAQARAALAAGQLEQAEALLEPLDKDFPDNAELVSVRESMTRYRFNVNVSAAEDALWAARREYRRQPASAVARLEALDVSGLPEPLVRQVFGEWARACARLCRARGFTDPLRYAPDPGRGAVLRHDKSQDAYVVVSALGMGPVWQDGSVVSAHYVRRARPLR